MRTRPIVAEVAAMDILSTCFDGADSDTALLAMFDAVADAARAVPRRVSRGGMSSALGDRTLDCGELKSAGKGLQGAREVRKGRKNKRNELFRREFPAHASA